MHWRCSILVCFSPLIAVAQEPARVDALGDVLPLGVVARLGSGRWRHGGPVQYLSFSADGTQLSAFHNGNGVPSEFMVWDAATGKELKRAQLYVGWSDGWQRLANGRSVALPMHGSGPYPIPMEVIAPKLPPFAPQRGSSASSTGAWPPTGNDYEQGYLNGPFLVTPPNKHNVGAIEQRPFALSFDGKSYARPGDEPKEGATTPIDIWDMSNFGGGRSISGPTQFGAQPGRCVALRYSPDGRTLVAFSAGNIRDFRPVDLLAIVWDTATGRERRRFRLAAPRVISIFNAGAKPAYQFAGLEASNTHLAVVANNSGEAVQLYDLNEKDDREIKTGQRRAMTASGAGVTIGVAPDGRKLLTGGPDGSVKSWEIATGRELVHLPHVNPSAITSMALDVAGKRLACGGREGVIHVWDLASQREIAPGAAPQGLIERVAVNPDGGAAAMLAADGSLRFYDPATGRERATIALPVPDRMTRFALAPDGRTLLLPTGGKVRAWDITTGTELKAPALPGCFSAQFGDDKTLILMRPGELAIHDWPSGQLRRTIPLPTPKGTKGEVRAMTAALSPDGRWLAAISGRYETDGFDVHRLNSPSVDLWDATTGAHADQLLDEGAAAYELLFAPSGELVLRAHGKLRPRDGSPVVEIQDGSVQFVDPATGRLRRSIRSEHGIWTLYQHWPGSALAMSRDGRTLYVAGDYQGPIRAYEMQTGQLRRELFGHRGIVTSLAPTPDGRRLVSGSADLTGLVWDTSLGSAKPDDRNSPDYLWALLTEDNAKTAYEAMTQLAARPKAMLDLIRTGVRPVPNPPDDAALDRLVAELADAKFTVRDRAQRALEHYGESVTKGLQTRRPTVTSAEAGKRIDSLIARFDPDRLTPVRLREERALELLENLNTPETRAVLAELAKGAAGARLTRDAAASRRRVAE